MITHPILDPSLTPLGRSQAADLATALQREAKKGMPLPEKWFVSPLRRTGETCGIEWGWVLDDGTPGERGMSHGVPAIVIEVGWRVTAAGHSNDVCDIRISESTSTYTSATSA